MIAAPAANVEQPLAEELRRGVKSVAASLEKRFGSNVLEGRRDLLLAAYVLGLTTPFHDGGPPADHVAAMLACLESVMPADRAKRAIEAVPDGGEAWPRALVSMEAIGNRDGHAIFMRRIGVDGVAAQTRAGIEVRG